MYPLIFIFFVCVEYDVIEIDDTYVIQQNFKRQSSKNSSLWVSFDEFIIWRLTSLDVNIESIQFVSHKY